jgi:peptidoglycan/LPS O-acetylase OafA/YrhL
MPVIPRHARRSAFHFGFFGADVFLRISGYHTTGIIAAERAEGRCSIARFRERRARRILPVLLVVMAACIPGIYLASMPPQFEKPARSVPATPLSTSNVFSRHFDAAAGAKPLPHAWILAIGEQYRIVSPFVLTAFRRRGPSRAAIALVDRSVRVAAPASAWRPA